MRVCSFALFAVLWLTGSATAQLTPEEVAAVARFEGSYGLGSIPREMRAAEAARVAESYGPARERFAGQGARVAGHFLRHTGTPPSTSAYGFVIEAVSDYATVKVLVDGLVDTPDPQSGPEFTSGGRAHRLPRYEGEIASVLESALVPEDVRRDPRVAQAIDQAIGRARAKPNGIATGPAARALELLGHCESDAARDALRRLAADSDPRFRAAAIAALGQAGGEPDAELLARSLLHDPQAPARLEAALAIGRKGLVDAVPALRQALAEERAPEVVDAVVQALAQLRALPDDRRLCLDAVARGWDPGAIAPAFVCWLAGADRAAIVDAATQGPPLVRGLAMAVLVPRPPPSELTLMRFAAPPAPPPPVAVMSPSGAAPIVAALPPPLPPPSRPAVDPALGTRLLASAVEVLSRPTRASPERPGMISHGLASQVDDLLYDFAGGDMALALAYADSIRTPGARTPNDGRMAASHALWRADRSAYEAIRTRRQALLGAALTLLALLLSFVPGARRAAIAAAVPLALWTIGSLSAAGVRELPPLDMAPMTIGGSGSLVAAAVAAAAVWWRQRGHAPGWLLGVLTGAGASGAAAVAAFFACGMLRWYGVYPIGGEGWELIFDPIGAAAVAAMLTAIAVSAASLRLPRRREERLPG